MDRLKFIILIFLLAGLVLVLGGCGENGDENGGEEEASKNFYREEFYRKYCEAHMKIQPELGHYGKGYAAQDGTYESFDECVEKNIEQEEMRYSACSKESPEESYLCDSLIPLARTEYIAHMTRERCQSYMWTVCFAEQYEEWKDKSYVNFCSEMHRQYEKDPYQEIHIGACDAVPAEPPEDFQKYLPGGYQF